MAERKPPRRTRERILETSLALFNRLGEPHVTTADIADEMNIIAGQPLLPFPQQGRHHRASSTPRTRRSVKPLLAVPDDPPPGVEDLWFMLHVLFEQMRDYRFLYRDLDEITSRNRKVAMRFGDLLRRLERTVIELCRSLVRTGEMRASEREIAALAANAALVSIYWMSWQRITGMQARPAPRPVPQARRASATPPTRCSRWSRRSCVGDGRALIERLGADYL